MKCPNEGLIQAYIDKELNDFEMKEIEIHLSQCEKCKETYTELNSLNKFTLEKLNVYKEDFNVSNLKPTNLNIEMKSKKGVFKDMKKYKNIAVAACAALAITTCVTVEPIRATIIDAVSIFRAKEIKSVDISLSDINDLEKALQEHKTDIDIDKIGKVNFHGGERKTVTLDEAKTTLPFTLSLPTALSDKTIESVVIDEPSKIDFTLNVENVNEILKSLGGKNIFPKDLDGKTFSFNTSGILNVSYRDVADNKHISVTESKVPELLAPADANVDEIFNALSELSVLPPNIQKQLKSMKDWQNTLYVPNVENEFEELDLGGTKAVGHFEDTNENKNSYVLILKNDVLISLYGNVDKNEILEIAKTMR
ncbi:anti-sigma factor family protein [Clostridium cellulovorans]|uniref:Putative zinc-finger domain-containing protein n=1 Tax=Clostridium cellulovorans (strain ATCC 35296 / DSM 3052 / OCM 3 / 743B) TaxID=573061 RepID=D9SQE3_CLOC7|nr:zf-HC2 domain-containing protein [Clostridium cellulovorans]ADL50210.1 hypothetical protein Clocel_0433 [Clostridium cellulovorans 743B]